MIGGSVSTPAFEVDCQQFFELLAEVVAVPSPAGQEEPVASLIGAWLLDRYPGLQTVVDRFAPHRANLECSAETPRDGDLVLYGHLDTSLTGDPDHDRLAVPSGSPPALLDRQGDVLSGPGLGVAKGPAIAALMGYLAAAGALAAASRRTRAALLLAAGGTHRGMSPGILLSEGAPCSGAGDGVKRFLDRHRPGAAVVAKCGPEGVLFEEPGAAYLTVEVTGTPALVMSRGEGDRSGGVPAAVGTAMAGFEAWRRDFMERPIRHGSQIGRQAGVGALAAGLPYKADVIGGLLQLHLYVVLATGDQPNRLADEIERCVTGELCDAGWTGLGVHVRVVSGWPAERTDPSNPLVRLAEQVYTDVNGVSSPTVRRWTGSTDGVLLRRAGIDTVRFGPTPMPAPLGTERLSATSLYNAARQYASLVMAFSLAQDGERPSADNDL